MTAAAHRRGWLWLVALALFWFAWMFRYEPVRYFMPDGDVAFTIAWDRWTQSYDFKKMGPAGIRSLQRPRILSPDEFDSAQRAR